MTAWAQLLHFYQPPTQTHDVLRRVADESYRPLIRVIREHENARLAVNINGVLTELLLDHGLGDVVDGLRELAERGRVEFTGSGKFHPILPLIPEAHRRRSISENASTNRTAFGAAWQPRGFFTPELCYSPDILPAIAGAGHEWLVLSAIACPAPWTTDSVYRVHSGGRDLAVLFRDDGRSNSISFRRTDAASFVNELASLDDGHDRYVMTAMDAETYGHHLRRWESEFLGAAFAAAASTQGAVELVLPSDLLERFPMGPVIEPLPSSWSTGPGDIVDGVPYPLWSSPGNLVHALQWEIVGHCLALTDASAAHADTEASRRACTIAAERLQPALHSCQFWWASRRPMWDVPMIHRGLQLLMEVALFAA
ncbi:MAG: hypothetical protein ACRDG3_07155, partial [Tepidiformaceae bacterium]